MEFLSIHVIASRYNRTRRGLAQFHRCRLLLRRHIQNEPGCSVQRNLNDVRTT